MFDMTNQDSQYAPWLAPNTLSPKYKSKDTLAKSILLLPHNFALDKQKGKQRCDHVIESSYLCNDIIAVDIPIGSYGKLRSGEADSLLFGIRLVPSNVED